jgi:hypothetical protein
VEKGEARFAAREGKLPFHPRIGRSYRYADLRGPGGAFATIDYGDDPPSLFVGREASLGELALGDTVASRGPALAPRKRTTTSGGK